MSTQRARLYLWAMFMGMAVYTLILYPSLPDRIPVHWNWRGEIDGWGPKSMIFMFPGLILLSIVALETLPALSPGQFRIDRFRGTFNYIVAIVAAMMTCTGIIILRAVQNHDMDLTKALIVVISLFLALLGNVMGKVRRNFYVGVRTPWTLASEKVWNETHRVAARWMVAGGIISALLAMLGVNMGLCFAVIIVTALYPVLFSFFYYKRLEGRGDL